MCQLQVVMKLMEMLDTQGDYVTNLIKKLAPPLVTLLSAEPEIQYVALRNINLIVQKRYCIFSVSRCFVKPACSERDNFSSVYVLCAFMHLSGFVWAITCYINTSRRWCSG